MDRRQPDRILIGINFKKIIKRDISFYGGVSFFALCRCGDGLRLYAAGDLMDQSAAKASGSISKVIVSTFFTPTRL